jgi:hypothetical protein
MMKICVSRLLTLMESSLVRSVPKSYSLRLTPTVSVAGYHQLPSVLALWSNEDGLPLLPSIKVETASLLQLRQVLHEYISAVWGE